MVGNNYFSCVLSICTYKDLFIEVVIHGHYNIHVLSSFTYPNLSPVTESLQSFMIYKYFRAPPMKT
jgi:hypothetical protein